MDMRKIRVACTALGRRLVIARFGKNERLALDQREAEADIMTALVDHMMDDAPNGSFKDFKVNGVWYRLTLQPRELVKAAAKNLETGESR